MYFDLTLNKNKPDEMFKLLNSSAREFYFGNNEYQDNHFPIVLKGIILSGMIDFERTLRGTFGSDLHMDYVDLDVFKEMYPWACHMFHINNPTRLKTIGLMLDAFRNMNAHAVLSEKDAKFFNSDFEFLKDQRTVNGRIVYYDGEVTVAGLMFIMLCFLRQQSIDSLCRKNSIFRFVACKGWDDNGEYFVEKISHVNLEVDIRRKKGDNIADSILGDIKELNASCGNEFSIEIGNEIHPIFKVDGSAIGANVFIKAHSLTRVFYDNDYQLTIAFEEGFVELANMLPSFALVDYLYAKQISVFDEETYNAIKNNWAYVSKLNKPKYYVDKNLHILLLPNTVSDFRIVSGMLLDNLQQILLLVEDHIYKNRNIETNGNISTIIDAFKGLGANADFSLAVGLLRNLVAHGYILDEYFYFKNRYTVFSIDFVIDTLNRMLKFFEREPELHDFLAETITNHLLKKLVSCKYKMSAQFCYALFETFPEYEESEWKKKDDFIEHSMCDITRFNCLIMPNHAPIKVIRLTFEGMPRKLYIFDSETAKAGLDTFCSKHGYRVYQTRENGLLIDYDLKKA